MHGQKNMVLSPKAEKILIGVLCGGGVVAAGCGLALDNDTVFVLGLAKIVVGYALLRRRLKQLLREKGALR